MAKGNRNMSIESTFLQHSLLTDSNIRNGYKPFKCDCPDTGRLTDNENMVHEQKQLQTKMNKLSANSLQSSTTNSTSTGTNRNINHNNNNNNNNNSNNSFSSNSINGVLTLKKISPTYLPVADSISGNGVSSTGNIKQLSAAALMPNHQSAPNLMGNRRGAHYLANITSSTANTNLLGKKPPLVNISSMFESNNQTQTSPINIPITETMDQYSNGISQSQQPMYLNEKGNFMSELTDLFDVNTNGNNRNGIGGLLASLALMCILSLLMAFLSLTFIQRSYSLTYGSNDPASFTYPFPSNISMNNYNNNNNNNKYINHRIINNAQFNQRIVSNTKEYLKVFQISISLSTLTIALDLCCLFVCCIQFLSIIKLLKAPFGTKRTFEFIKKTSHIRVISIGAFLVSIPIFFTGIILYTFVNFDEIPALITSIIIGIGIIFCGVASVQNVYLWQWEKTKASQDMQLSQQQHQQRQQQYLRPSFIYANGQQQQQQQQHHPTPPQQQQTRNGNYPLELSTLV